MRAKGPDAPPAATPVPSITPYPAPTGTSFAIVGTAPATYGSATNVVVAQGAALPVSSPQPLGVFVSTFNGGTAYCDPYSTCANRLAQNQEFMPYDFDLANPLNTVPYASNYHLSVFAIDASPPFQYLLVGAYD